MTRVLFVSVHPDDETLGCGGTILKYRELGYENYWLNITDIDCNHPYGFSEEAILKRRKTIEIVNKTYGFTQLHNLKHHTMLLDKIGLTSLIPMISKVILEISPSIVFLPNRSDVHSDHQIAFKAVYACTKSFRYPSIKEVLMYETLSETEFAPAVAETAFIPNTYIDISQFMDKKLEIIQMYDTEIMPDPLPRSLHAIKGLAGYRGSRIGVKYAEAFQMIYRAL